MDSGYLVFPQIDPVMIKIFGLSIHWYGMMYLLAFVMAHVLANRAAAKPNSGWTKDQVGDLLFYGFLGVVLGGRVGYVLFYNFQKFVEDPTYLFKTWEGGMSFHGGVIGVLLAMAYFARRYQKNYLALGDFVVVLLPLGLGAGRIGNFINGELWGRVSDVPWAMLFPSGGTLPRHPSQLYEFFFEGIVLFIMLMLYRRQSPPAGAVAGLFLLGYGVFRFGIEFFREPDKHLDILNLGMTMGQWLCVPMIISGLFFIGWGYWRRQKGAAY